MHTFLGLFFCKNIIYVIADEALLIRMHTLRTNRNPHTTEITRCGISARIYISIQHILCAINLKGGYRNKKGNISALIMMMDRIIVFLDQDLGPLF